MPTSIKSQSTLAQQGKLMPSGHEENVRFPDLFISFQALEPRFHPRYQQVKEESESWIAEYVVRNDMAD